MEAECRYVGFFGTRCLMKNNTKYFLCSTQKKKLKKKKKEKNQQTTQQQQKKICQETKEQKPLAVNICPPCFIGCGKASFENRSRMLSLSCLVNFRRSLRLGMVVIRAL